VRSIFRFEDALRDAIHRFKYDGLSVLAEPLGALMAAYWWTHPLAADVVVPVPLHRRRVRERGYNQSALLAEAVSLEHDVSIDTEVLVRHRATVPQVGLSVDRRSKNVQGAFRCNDDRLKGADVLVIDDVCTTGATVEACAVALLDSGARSVRALTLSRADFGADVR
jgi:ComF family protein